MTPEDPTQSSTLADAYFDRNQLALAFARGAFAQGWTGGLSIDPENPDWPILYLDSPEGQISWHLPAAEVEPSEWPVYQGEWDGHTLAEKRARLASLISRQGSDQPLS